MTHCINKVIQTIITLYFKCLWSPAFGKSRKIQVGSFRCILVCGGYI